LIDNRPATIEKVLIQDSQIKIDMMQKESPLADVIIADIVNNEQVLDERELPLIKEEIRKRVKGIISKEEIYHDMKDCLKDMSNIDWLESILSIETNMNKGEEDDSYRKKSRIWTQYEDKKLLYGIHKYGLGDWEKISLFVGNGRSRAQCAQRWNRGLDPKISKDHWTREEEIKLLEIIKDHGVNGWTQIAKMLGNRCDVQCRYRYLQMKKDKKVPDDFDDTVLLPGAKSLSMKKVIMDHVPNRKQSERTQQSLCFMKNLEEETYNDETEISFPPPLIHSSAKNIMDIFTPDFKFENQIV